MIVIDNWMRELADKLRDAFGDGLLFVGLQGSHRRGEATDASDIDAVVILDRLGVEELDRYRAVLDAMPEREKSCGFIGDRETLSLWPRHEIFQFDRDTRAYYGGLEELLPPVSRADIADGVRNGVSGLYHLACHEYVHGNGERRREALRGAGKGAFFILQALHYLRSGEYVSSKSGLLPLLSADEQAVLAPDQSADTTEQYRRLITWCAAVLREMA